jgi:flagellar protein FlbD
MIRLTRLSGAAFVLNCEQIKCVESTPDSVVTLLSGEKLIVQESADVIVDRVVEFGKRLRAFQLS